MKGLKKMYNKHEIDRLAEFVDAQVGQKNKEELAELIQTEFNLTKKRSVYTGESFSIRFSKGKGGRFDNTVLALSTLKKYDEHPFIVCVVDDINNSLLLANTTFLKKISHSSKELRMDNIKGSFNGSDIYKEYIGINNNPENFEELFAIHEGIDFEENLERLVQETNTINPQDKRVLLNNKEQENVLDSIRRTQDFMNSKAYRELEKILESKVQQVSEEINLLAQTDNVNLRGRRIEYLVTTDYQATQPVREAVLKGNPIPAILTPNTLGDYTFEEKGLTVEVDIKTKLTDKGSEPKGYNVDKLLELLSHDNTVFMLYIILVNPVSREIKTKLISVLDEDIIEGTTIQHHWAGRNSRGVAQFSGQILETKTSETEGTLNAQVAHQFLEHLINL